MFKWVIGTRKVYLKVKYVKQTQKFCSKCLRKQPWIILFWKMKLTLRKINFVILYLAKFRLYDNCPIIFECTKNELWGFLVGTRKKKHVWEPDWHLSIHIWLTWNGPRQPILQTYLRMSCFISFPKVDSKYFDIQSIVSWITYCDINEPCRFSL